MRAVVILTKNKSCIGSILVSTFTNWCAGTETNKFYKEKLVIGKKLTYN